MFAASQRSSRPGRCTAPGQGNSARRRAQLKVERLEQRTLLSGVPTPAHVVVVMEENHSYSEIIGSSQAPYINSLAQQGALMTNSFAIQHPSEPNYLDIFSGSNQGITSDGFNMPGAFSTPNLSGELIKAGVTFGAYIEGYPTSYDHDHAPWDLFVDVPSSAEHLFQGSFPTNFTQLPTVSIVTPNVNDDMHNGTIQQGDQWLQSNIDAYAQWAKANNSLLIVTWDEDDGSAGNHIATLFVGSMVQPGQYSKTINHFSVLRTIEDMYGLPYAGASASATPITDIWTGASSVLAAPSNLTANAASPSEIDLAWTNNAGNATSVKIERSTDGTNFTQINTVGGSAITYKDTGLTAGTKYYYRVRASNSAGNSAYSNVVNATTLQSQSVPAAPSNLVANSVFSSEIDLAWTNNAINATNVLVERSIDNVNFTQIAQLSSTANGYNNTGLNAGTTYYYRVRAANSVGDSSYSNVTSATTQSVTSSGWVHVQDSPGGTQMASGFGSSRPIGAFASRNTVGDIIIVWGSLSQVASPGQLMVSDNGGNAYTQVIFQAGLYSTCVVFIAQITHLATSGNLNPVLSTSAGTTYLSACASEFSGGSINLDGSSISNSGTSATPNGGSISTASPGDLLISVMGDASGQGGNTITPPANFVEVGNNSTSAGNPGDGSYRVLSGSVTNLNVQWSLSFSVSWEAGVVAIKSGAPSQSIPAAPSNLTANAVSSSEIDLTWHNNATNATNVLVERSIDNINFTQIAQLTSTASSYQNTGLNANTAYYYRVRAANSAGDSSYSNVANSTTQSVTSSGWVHVQDSPGGTQMASGFGSSLHIGAFASSNTVGDIIVVWGSLSQVPSPGQLMVSDNGGNAYTQVVFQGGPYITCVVFISQITHLATSGNLNPVLSTSAGATYLSACASEFSGGSINLDGSSISNSGTSATPNGGSISTASPGDLLISVMGDASGQGGNTITPPANFVEVGNNSTSAGNPGDGSYRVLSGTVTNLNVQWSLSFSVSWEAGVVAVKAAARSQPPPHARGNPRGNAASSGEIDLAWTKNASIATSVKIERSLDDTNFTQIGTVGGSSTTYKPGGRSSGGGSAQGNDILLPQDSLLLNGGQQADCNGPSSAPVTRSGASTTRANQPARDRLFSSESGGTGAALSSESRGMQLDCYMA